uniref:Uncharacterized protein n=1 Tax=Setaria italica TaxID=4555 RepID=K3ZGP8_SETIT
MDITFIKFTVSTPQAMGEVQMLKYMVEQELI